MGPVVARWWFPAVVVVAALGYVVGVDAGFAIALLLFAVILKVGLWMLRGFAQPIPEPDEGELRRVNLRYRCSICGVELKMTVAPNEEPEPPRHCQEDMDLVAPAYD